MANKISKYSMYLSFADLREILYNDCLLADNVEEYGMIVNIEIDNEAEMICVKHIASEEDIF